MLKNPAVLTRPTPARRDAPFPRLLSRLIEILNVPIEILGERKSWRGFPFVKIHRMGQRAPEARSVPPPVSSRLRPRWGEGASRRAGVGRVRSLDVLIILSDAVSC